MVEDLSWWIAAMVILVMLPGVDGGTFTTAVAYALLYSTNEVGVLLLAAIVEDNIGTMLVTKAKHSRIVIVFFLIFPISLFSFFSE